ncbi:hypothetical protein [Austwickia sp. TVS 96-490-7B]|uniref:hypothetical protein n=1 Tax=Austwickia sp. TVS 96-490-7B TaxID=2830843 RepID=UPI001C57A0A5|nr:hypothetical protein [Austwickia sp. TVS 96-490-7B]
MGEDSDDTQAIPAVIGAGVIAPASWCAKGALGSVPTSALEKALTGETSWIRNAVIGCLVGNVGGSVWNLVSPSVKSGAINAVISFLIRMS